MIEVISATKCIECNQCVAVCPTNVFDRVEGGIPVIARQDDCQTCFMCELYCPVDALYVAPDSEALTGITEQELQEQGFLGGYREKVGWGKGRKPVASHNFMVQLSARAGF
ncbi:MULTISPECIES: ferredoxin family protein [Paenibacillus]|uniref:4Fe-4S dicluster domain-containing protein n=1 Tax=Paenibacillus TaxID=44249 RepID=UPI0007BEA9E6|nr:MULTISPECIES: ferredoxin family protein [Paenibacillus]WDQ34328.1 ferredoxin family protein [Paenibacillus marchantiae]SHN85198.1 NAD-dependent dihydropyrimidine dehydrogenase, PreA subunit [Paenibacillus sp. ov031]SLK18762.1 NAD-dependent dihydropyrimidine dehydrogenase, PreA subunit [Paenibacillus sp. RU5A]SOC75399.1 NAD-dependent dihydropyrimidine dehydrogenase, PreA subunit [Paenibacillus sp. RU26A]SOC77377.1 NAD-dependent dihydropyrimidine dehydrogenase, PreA subunit [Paenibacillus sp.